MVPVKDIIWYWENVVLKNKPEGDREFNRKLAKYEDYVEKIYVGGVSIDGGHRKPRFAPEMWNKSESAQRCREVTTNNAEVRIQILLIYRFFKLFISQVFNKHIAICRRKMCNLWTLLEGLREEEGLTREKISQASQGIVPYYMTTSREKKRKQMKEQFAKLCSEVTRENALNFSKENAAVFDDCYYVE